MEILLEGLKEKEPQKEVEVLKKYYEHIRFGISGKKKKIPVLELKDMLRWKGKQLLQQVRENEWIELSSKEGFLMVIITMMEMQLMEFLEMENCDLD